MEIIFQLKDIDSVAQNLIDNYFNTRIWAFHGNMGAGKTTLIHALCTALEVKDTVSSPTYSIINEYQTSTNQTIYHMDWYRLKDIEEAINAGVEDAINSGNICWIEWPERALDLLPDNVLNIELTVIDNTNRKLSILQ